MHQLLYSPLLQRQRANDDQTYAIILYGGAMLISLYMAYLAWLKPEDYLEATQMGSMQIPISERVRVLIGRFLFPLSVLLWIALLYIAFSS